MVPGIDFCCLITRNSLISSPVDVPGQEIEASLVGGGWNAGRVEVEDVTGGAGNSA